MQQILFARVVLPPTLSDRASMAACIERNTTSPLVVVGQQNVVKQMANIFNNNLFR